MNLLVGLCIVLSLALSSLADHPENCPEGYTQVDRQCFLLIEEAVSFVDATGLCDIVDGDLVQITSAEDNERVKQFLEQKTTIPVWMGATHIQGKWLMLSSHNMYAMEKFSYWGPDFPEKNPVGNMQCATIWPSERMAWKNHGCSEKFQVLCEVRLRQLVDSSIVGRR